MSPLPVITERLVLRATTPADTDAVLSYCADGERLRFVPFGPYDADTIGARVARMVAATDPQVVGEALQAVVELPADEGRVDGGRVVGDVMLRLTAGPFEGDRAPSTGEVGWMLHPSYAGRGLATEAARAVVDLAFGHYGLHRVSAILDPGNLASARVCERLGMRLEGIGRRDFWAKGEWSDTATYGLLAEEWQAGSRGANRP